MPVRRPFAAKRDLPRPDEFSNPTRREVSTEPRTTTPKARTVQRAVVGRALAPAEDVEAVSRYNLVWSEWRTGKSSADIAAQLGLPLAVVEEFEVVGLPSQGLPALLDRERLRVRSVLVAGDELVEAEVAKARTAEEASEVHIRAVKTQADRVVKAIDDGLKSKEEEAKLVRANRTVALSMARVNANLLEGALSLSKIVGKRLKEADGEEGAQLDLATAMKALKQVGEIAKITAETSRIAVQLERLVLGEPTSIVGHVAGETADTELREMSPENAAEWISKASAAFEKHQRRIKAIDVGEVVTAADGTKLALRDARH